MTSTALTALRDEAAALATALRELPEPAWDRPTRCTPWRVRDLVGHVVTVVARVSDAVTAPAPAQPAITATEYFRADERFGGAANADRVRTAQDRAAASTGLLHEFADTWQTVVAVCRHQPEDRVVRTRHGDAMLLAEFLSTRVFEVAVHGLDAADAVDRPPWLTPAAAEHLQEMLFGPGWRAAAATIGWDAVTLVRKATGRGAVSAAEAAALDRHRMRRLTVG